MAWLLLLVQPMTLYLYRLFGALTLDAGMYEGIEADRSLTVQATLTVILSSVATGIAASALGAGTPAMIPALSAVALVTWLAWAYLMYQIGVRILPGPETRSSFGELLRTIGFAAAPGCVQVFALLPRMGWPVMIGTSVWMLAAMVVAVRHALDYTSVWRALAVCALAAALCAGVAVVLALLTPSPLS
jgi:hypothetical protein